MTPGFVDTVVERLTQSGLANEDSLHGCSEEEIRQLERIFQLSLPTAYQHFLRRMGRSAGEFLVGTDFLDDRLPELRGAAERLLERSATDFRLSADHFVFAMHQGYQFLFFDSRASDDPPVFLYLEDEPAPEQVSDSFSSWLLSAMEDEVEGFRDVEDSA
jgi:hypothetical protein